MESSTEVNAKKTILGRDEALKLAEGVNEIYVAKGKRVVHLDLRKERPEAAALAALLLGPTGNLRAPTLRIGETLVVGFDVPTYHSLFVSRQTQ